MENIEKPGDEVLMVYTDFPALLLRPHLKTPSCGRGSLFIN